MASAEDFIKQLDAIKSTGGEGGGPMTADDFIKLLNGAPPAEGYDGSLLGGFARSAAQGATANFSDELVGMVGGDKEGLRKQQNAFEREHPWIDGIGKGVGAIGSTVGLMLTPGGQPAAAARAAGWGARGLNAIRGLFGVNNAVKAIPGANAAVNLSPWAARIPGIGRAANLVAGTNARRGGLAAAQYGITARAGDYEGESDPEKGIIPNALDHAGGRMAEGWDLGKIGMDYAAGGVLTKGFNTLFPGLSQIDNLVQRAGQQSGVKMVADAARRDGIRPEAIDNIRTSLLPTLGRGNQAYTPDAMLDAIGAFQRAVANGANEGAAYAAMAQVLARRDTAGRAASTLERNARTIMDRFNDRNPIQMQLHELLKQADDSGAINMHDLVQKGVSSQGLEDATHSAALYRHASDRQEGMGDTVRTLLERHLYGDGRPGATGTDLIEDLIRRVTNSERIANSLYPGIKADAANNPEVGQQLAQAIERVAQRLQAELGGQTDDYARAIQQHLQKFMHPEEEVVFGSLASPKLSFPTRTLRDEAGNITGKVKGEGVPVYQDVGNGQLFPMVTHSDPITQTVQRGTPNMANYIGNRSNLTREIERLKSARDPAYAGLSRLKGYLDEEVFGLADDAAREAREKALAAARKADPNAPDIPKSAGEIFSDFRNANAQRADAHQLRVAFQTGVEFQPNATAGKSLMKMNQQLSRLDRMPEEAQQMFLGGLLAQLKAKLEVKGDFHDLAKVFKTERMRNLMGRFMGADDADAFMRQIDNVATASQTFNMRTGSPTARLMDHSTTERLLNSIRALTDMMLSPIATVRAGAEYLGDAATRGMRNDAMGIAGQTTGDLGALDASLRAIQQRLQGPTAGPGRTMLRDAGPFTAIPATQFFTEEYKTGDF